MFESSKKQIYVNLEPYYNSYTLEAGKEFRMPDTLFITPALQKGESYMYNEIDNFAFLNKTNPKSNTKPPILKIKLKAGDVSDDNNSFKIGVIDQNNNGIFNEKLIDQFFIAPYQSKQTLIEKANPWISTIGKANVFKVNNISYKLLFIDQNGNSLTLKKLSEKNSSSQSIPIQAITNIHTSFQLTNLKGNPIKSTDIFNKKPLYLEYWFNACSGCIKSFDYIQSIGLDEFDLVGVNGLDEIPVIQSFNPYHGFDFDHYQITESMMKRIGNMGVYPSAVKYDENGQLVDQFYHFQYKED